MEPCAPGVKSGSVVGTSGHATPVALSEIAISSPAPQHVSTTQWQVASRSFTYPGTGNPSLQQDQ